MRRFSLGPRAKKMDMGLRLVNAFIGFVITTMLGTILLGSAGSTLVLQQDIPSKTCRYSRTYSMLQVRCANLSLVHVPATLKTDIQILDLSGNRLRELTNDSLALYKNLAFVYLGDNFIRSIHEDAFSNLHYLEVLDLTQNGCDNLPRSMFQLPYLRKMYLGKNDLQDDMFTHIKVVSPLNFLQLSVNKLKRIPQMGLVPTLDTLNVSRNSIESVTPEDLAPFCFLKSLDLSKNPIKFNATACQCQTLNHWFKTRNIRVKPAFNCSEELKRDCPPDPVFSNRTSELYDQCTEIERLRIQTEKVRNIWILVACCIGGFLLSLCVGLTCVHKRNKRRKKKLKEQQRLNANNANTELLNSNLNQPENT
ncbi:leucine-rich repeat activity-regulated protein at synapses [Halictus rubicundus]|uniref:leucine-rich repeat activity-regulated protein at synapses n=1 Tax=Halictus rubicundus TaxID=77578 RepID=UPI0040366644